MTNILIKNFADLCFGISIFLSFFIHSFICFFIWQFEGGLSFLVCGFAFAFGTGSPFIGYTYFSLIDFPSDRYAFFFFQVNRLFLQKNYKLSLSSAHLPQRVLLLYQEQSLKGVTLMGTFSSLSFSLESCILFKLTGPGVKMVGSVIRMEWNGIFQYFTFFSGSFMILGGLV